MPSLRGWAGLLLTTFLLLAVCVSIITDYPEPQPKLLVPRSSEEDAFPWTPEDLSTWNPIGTWFSRSRRPVTSLQRLWHIPRNVEYPAHTDGDLGLVHLFSIWLPGFQCLLMVTPLGAAVGANCAGLKVANPRVIGTEWVAGFKQAARGSLGVSKPLLYHLHSGSTLFVPWPPSGHLSVPGQESGLLLHHDLDFNPATGTFMALAHAIVRRVNASGSSSRAPRPGRRVDMDVDREGHLIAQDMLLEVGLDGTLRWQWCSLPHIPFNQSLFGFYPDQLRDLKQRFPGTSAVDWTHLNSVYYDSDAGAVYVNSRHLDTFYKVDRGSGLVAWAVGRAGSVTLMDLAGEMVPGLFWHAHAVTKVGPEEFLLFDNNNHNLMMSSAGCPHRMDRGGRCAAGSPAGSRLVWLRVYPSNRTARELLRWASNPDYYTPYHGDADVLPNGHLIGTFPGRDCLVEVDPRSGKVVWELCARNSARNSSRGQDGSLFALESTRLLRWPLVTPVSVHRGVDVHQWRNYSRLIRVVYRTGSTKLPLHMWNSFPQRFTTKGTLAILNRSGSVLWESSVKLLPDWRPTRLTVSFAQFLGAATQVSGSTQPSMTCCGTTHAFRLQLAVPRYHPVNPNPGVHSGSTGVMLHCLC